MKYEKLYLRSSFNYSGFPEFASRAGVDTDALRSELALESEVFTRNANIVSWNAICSFYERAAAQIEDKHLGLRFSLNAKPDFSILGLVVYIGALSSDVYSFYDMIARYQEIRSNGMDLEYIYDKNEASKEIIGRYKVHPDSAAHIQVIESNIGSAALSSRKLIPGYKVKYISFMHQGSADDSIFAEVFDAPVYFGAKENRLVFDITEAAELGNQFSDSFRNFALKTFFKGRIDNNPKAGKSLNGFVETMLPLIMGLGLSDINSFARSLNMHPKKLQRLLKDENNSYSSLLDNIRRELAESYLKNSNLPIAIIAQLLDYSSDRSFSTAFKRWNDIAPNVFRKKTRSEAGKMIDWR